MAGNQTVTTGNAFRPEIWATDVLDVLKANLVLRDRISHFDREIKNKGQSVQIPIPAQMTANDKVANTEVTLQDNAATLVTINIDKHKESSVLIEDILEIQSAYDLRSVFSESLGVTIAEAIDKDVYTELIAAATASGQSVGTAATALTDEVVLASKTLLDKAKAPTRDRTLAVSPEDEAGLLAIDKYVRYDALGTGKAIVNGKVGTIYGYTVVSTQLVDGSSVAFHKYAVGIALQKTPRTQAQYQQKDLGWLLTVDTLYGVKTLRDTFAVEVKGASSS
jgi:N4-gp56 family major capsid protein